MGYFSVSRRPPGAPPPCLGGSTPQWWRSPRRAWPWACRVPSCVPWAACRRGGAMLSHRQYEKVYLFLVHLRPISGPLRTQVDRNPPRAAPPSDRGHGRPCLDWTGRHPPRARPARSPHAVQYSCGLYGGARGLRRWFSSAQRTAPACRRRPGRPRASAGTGARAARALHRLGASAGRMSS